MSFTFTTLTHHQRNHQTSTLVLLGLSKSAENTPCLRITINVREKLKKVRYTVNIDGKWDIFLWYMGGEIDVLSSWATNYIPPGCAEHRVFVFVFVFVFVNIWIPPGWAQHRVKPVCLLGASTKSCKDHQHNSKKNSAKIIVTISKIKISKILSSRHTWKWLSLVYK